MPKLSIIVPTLDGTIPRSLASIGREDVELVVVKGVSPVGKARNEGIARARGEYVAWVDADDEVTPEWLPEILAAVNDHPDVIAFDATRVGWKDGDESIVWGERNPSVDRLLRSIYQGIDIVCTMWMYVTRRTLWDGLRFDEEVAMCEDYLLAPSLLSRARSVKYLPHQLYRYTCRESSLVHLHGFTGDVRTMELKRRRAVDAPRRFRRAAALGFAVACYGAVVRVSRGFDGFRTDAWSREAAAERGFIRRHLLSLGFECLFRTRLPLRRRFGWIARFVWCCLPARNRGEKEAVR